jgi:hypothetical protein
MTWPGEPRFHRDIGVPFKGWAAGSFLARCFTEYFENTNSNTHSIDPALSSPLTLREAILLRQETPGRSNSMDYLFVLFGLASVGAVFAGLKTLGGRKKILTRLEL